MTPVQAVSRGLTMFVIVWQALTMFPDRRFWPSSQSLLIVDLLIVVAWITWVTLVAFTWGRWRDRRRRHRVEIVNAWVVLLVALTMLFSGSETLPDGWLAAATLINLGVGLVSLAYPWRRALVLVGVALLVEAFGLLRQAETTAGHQSLWLYVVYSGAIATAVIGTRRGLLVAAATAEEAQDEVIRAEAQAHAIREVQRIIMIEARRLHESVLNTLTAIARGLLPVDPALVRDQCQRAVTVLSTLADVSAETRNDEGLLSAIAPMVEGLRSRGVDVDIVRFDGERPPLEVSHAFAAATREALENVLRHADASRVTLDAIGDGRTWRLVVTDDGVGIDPSTAGDGFGIPNVIRREMEAVGGQARIDSAPGRGTTVTLTWSPTRAAVASSSRWLDAGRTAMAVAVLVSFHVFSLASLLVSLDDYEQPLWAVGAYALSLASLVLIVSTGRRGVLAPWVVVVVGLVAPAILVLQNVAAPLETADGWADWGSEAIVSLLFAITGLGPWWAGIVALVSWLVAQGDALAELLRPGTAVIVAAMLFARSLRANERAVATAEAEASLTMARGRAERETVQHLAARYQALSRSTATSLLQGIADGDIDPTDPRVQVDCAVEERFIRSIMRLDPESGVLHAMTMRLALAAYGARRRLTVDLGDVVDFSSRGASALLQVEHSATAALDLLAPDEPVRLTVRQEGETVVMRIVGQLDAGVGQSDLPAMAYLSVDADDGTVLWEVVDV